MRKAILPCSLLLLPSSTTCATEPYLPASDAVVLVELPKALLADDSEMRALRQELSQTPDDDQLAVAVAKRYLKIGNQSGDPRFYGYARSALAPWWDTETAPVDVLMLRAKLQEKDHQYAQTLRDLEAVVALRPESTQAWFELANIHRVLGQYDRAYDACDQLGRFADETAEQLCRASIQTMTGDADAAAIALAAIADDVRRKWPDAATWVLTMQAQVAWSLGRLPEAEQFFVEGLGNEPDNTYLLRTYADFLLDRGRNDEALQLLLEHIDDNGVLLRAAIAAKLSDQPSMASKWQAQLKRRFEEIRLRGSNPHGRFESRYELQLNQDPHRALQIALANWNKQKELRDARNVLEAAVAVNDAEAAATVINFLRRNRTQNVELRRLVEALER